MLDDVKTLELTNPQDVFSREYAILAKAVVAKYGDEGDSALREAIRLFGATRGQLLREAHLEAGLKINLYNLFTHGDLPTDPRMRRNKINLCPQARLSETLSCALYDMWRELDVVDLGRIYCEEFHHAKFAAYAHKAQTNLTQTMTQGDDLCKFAVYLRPGNMGADEKALSFVEYGGPEPTPLKYEPLSYFDGFARLTVLLLDAFYRTVEEHFGLEGLSFLEQVLETFAQDIDEYLKNKATLAGLPYDAAYLRKNCPIPAPGDAWWAEMAGVLHPHTEKVIGVRFSKALAASH